MLDDDEVVVEEVGVLGVDVTVLDVDDDELVEEVGVVVDVVDDMVQYLAAKTKFFFPFFAISKRCPGEFSLFAFIISP